MPGILYLVPNTLGATDSAATNPLSEIIPEAVQAVVASLDYFIAENAKTARAFLKTVAITYPLVRPLQEIRISELNVNTEPALLHDLLAPIMAGCNGGLISEAGMPAVADPGANLVRLAHARNVRVKPLVGPSSLLLAVMASGLNGQSFAFNGYLPTDPLQRAKRIKFLEDRSRQEIQTQLFIETPYRNIACLEAIVQNCRATTLVCAATDLTLPSETVITRPAGEWKTVLSSINPPDIHKKPTVFLLLAD